MRRNTPKRLCRALSTASSIPLLTLRNCCGGWRRQAIELFDLRRASASRSFDPTFADQVIAPTPEFRTKWVVVEHLFRSLAVASSCLRNSGSGLRGSAYYYLTRGQWRTIRNSANWFSRSPNDQPVQRIKQWARTINRDVLAMDRIPRCMGTVGCEGG